MLGINCRGYVAGNVMGRWIRDVNWFVDEAVVAFFMELFRPDG
jgi:hypothetical protein